MPFWQKKPQIRPDTGAKNDLIEDFRGFGLFLLHSVCPTSCRRYPAVSPHFSSRFFAFLAFLSGFI
jgi:hypothetical protein